MSSQDNRELMVSKACITLLKKVVYRNSESKLWEVIVSEEAYISDYLSKIGLKLIINKVEDYARLKTIEVDEGENFPKLIPKVQLSVRLSNLLLKLTSRLIDFDYQVGPGSCFVTKADIEEMSVETFGKTNDEVKFESNLNTDIKELVTLGFLVELKDVANHYEVKRILRDLFEVDHVANMDKTFQEYRNYFLKIKTDESVDSIKSFDFEKNFKEKQLTLENV